jgi:hypothetical protein
LRARHPAADTAPSRRFITYYRAEEVQNYLAKGLVGSFGIASDLSYQFAYDERIVAFPKGRPRKAPK